MAVDEPGGALVGGGEQSLTACTIELLFLGSSQALAMRLLAFLPIPPKRARDGALWVSEGPRPEAKRALPGS